MFRGLCPAERIWFRSELCEPLPTLPHRSIHTRAVPATEFRFRSVTAFDFGVQGLFSVGPWICIFVLVVLIVNV